MLNINELKKAIEETKARSTWAKAVKIYALDLVENLNKEIQAGITRKEDINNAESLKKALLCGYPCWNAYSSSGCGVSLTTDAEIVRRVCTPSEIKKYKNGLVYPDECNTWESVQGSALFQAWEIIKANATF